MKKNFMAIASLLIAAMLLVVSCAPEAKVEDDGLVNASFSVAYGKDVVVKTNPGVTIDYTYSLTPEWTTLENGVEPFGNHFALSISPSIVFSRQDFLGGSEYEGSYIRILSVGAAWTF